MTFVGEEGPAPRHVPSRPQATTSPSIACSGRGKGKGKKKKKVKAKHSRNALPAGAGRGAGRPGRAGRAAAAPGRALGRAAAPAWPSRCSGRPSPACGAGRNFPGKSQMRRSAVSAGAREGGGDGSPARPGVPRSPGGYAAEPGG